MFFSVHGLLLICVEFDLPVIICSILDPLTTMKANCTDGEIRLTNGSNHLEGRVEVCFNRAWGTVCDTGFGKPEAEVVCRQLDSQFNYAHAGATPLRGAAFGEGNGPIFIGDLGCSGDERQLSSCFTFNLFGFHQCDHTLDAGVLCEGQFLHNNIKINKVCILLI